MMAQWTSTQKCLAAAGAVGVGLLILQSRRRYADHNACPVVLDPDLDVDTRQAVMAALTKEADPDLLHTLAGKLEAASHHRTAEVVARKAALLEHGGHVTGELVVSSRDVMKAQTWLRALGYDVLVNGVLDSRTIQAVERFQSLYDLDINGVLNPPTMAMLKNAAEGRI